MNVAEQIYGLVKTMPDAQTREILDFVEFLKNHPSRKQHLTARRLLNSSLVGLWRDRDDIADSAEYARVLRKQAQWRGE